ncbi:MAG: hypothetical protein NZ992_00475 [Candidatus Korarchaeum sp.]|nr:hypothetical protein [Candidatus Korarchaeum sp.]MDW8035432.1 hypothetical protein [Candidatus Korarchaeum sp.]
MTLVVDTSNTTSMITEWYRGAGSIKSVKRGLDDRSFIIELSGRREIRVLAVLYDPLVDEDLQEFVESLLDSYRRARIGFDRLDLWVPAPLYSRAQELMEEAERKGLGWMSNVSLRPLAVSRDLESERVGETKRVIIKQPEASKNSLASKGPEVSREVKESKEVSFLIQQVGREIGEGIARSLEESLKNILSSIDIRRGDPELLSKVYELEKRIELLESFIRILGNYGMGNVPQILKELPRETPRVQEQLRPSGTIEKDRPKIEETVMSIRDVSKGEEALDSSVSADEVLTEIFNNPWVSILRKKGDSVEGESD